MATCGERSNYGGRGGRGGGGVGQSQPPPTCTKPHCRRASPLRALPLLGNTTREEVPGDGHQSCRRRSNRPAMEQLLAFLRAAPGASLLLHNPLPASRSLPEALQAAASQILLSTHLRFPCDVAGFTISTMMGVTSSRECVEAMAILLPSYRPHRVPPLASGIHGAGGEASCRGVIPPS
ncbi:unnamed protein product [Triticum turgidum subsp. durum]|uniref:Uncharacterized protein n=1 Tax=Triticum turgidum subsp. durum TaxID=4567 RepID=A0A9R1R419_TRITD|nr:unnamed protein product [Triticum turgidum subsp. durum]